jgi:hypothetical protein
MKVNKNKRKSLMKIVLPHHIPFSKDKNLADKVQQHRDRNDTY